MQCPRCGSKSFDVYRFEFPQQMPMVLAIAVPKNIRSELVRLFENYRGVELHICMNCGYTEIRFLRSVEKH